MEYNKYLSTFKDCSYDSDNKIYLVGNETECFDLDNYFKDKFKELKVDNRPHSLDSIYSKTKNYLSKCLFVEFKNQNLNNLKEKVNVLYNKVFNSIIVFISENKCCIEDCAKNNYLLIVYSDYKNKISGQLNNLANKLGNLKGLERFKNYCFKDVKFITNIEFDDEVNKFNRLAN